MASTRNDAPSDQTNADAQKPNGKAGLALPNIEGYTSYLDSSALYQSTPFSMFKSPERVAAPSRIVQVHSVKPRSPKK